MGLLFALAAILARGSDFHPFRYSSEMSNCSGAFGVRLDSGELEARCLEVHHCEDITTDEDYTFLVFRTIATRHEHLDVHHQGIRRDWAEDARMCDSIFSSSIANVETMLAKWCVMESGMGGSVNVQEADLNCTILDLNGGEGTYRDSSCSRGYPSDNVVCAATPEVVAMYPSSTGPGGADVGETTVVSTVSPSKAGTKEEDTTANPSPSMVGNEEEDTTAIPATNPSPSGAGGQGAGATVVPATNSPPSGAESSDGSSGVANAGVYFIAPLIVLALVVIGVLLKHRRASGRSQTERETGVLLERDVAFVNPQYRPRDLDGAGGDESSTYVYEQTEGEIYDGRVPEYGPVALVSPIGIAEAEYDLAVDDIEGDNGQVFYDMACGEGLAEDEEGYLVPSQANSSDVVDFGV